MNLPCLAEAVLLQAPPREAPALSRLPAVDAPRGPPAGLPMGDWNAMWHAVTDRLRRSATGRANDAAAADVLDCVAALDQLHAALQQEMQRRPRLEQDLLDARLLLARTRAELHGTQAGERLARHLAAHDVLTALPNRGRFRERLEQALRGERAQRRAVAVMYIDLDGFKPINDRHGHAIGDEVLRIVATRLGRALRAKDIVGRLGGDEFACLVVDWQDADQLARLARKLFEAVAAPLAVGDIRLAVRPSIGVAMYPTHGLTPDELMRNADAAMYRAKSRRSGYAFCESPPARA